MSNAKEIVIKLMVSPVDSIIAQVPRALLVSVLAALLDVTLLIFFKEVFLWPVGLSAVISYLFGGVLQYVLCSLWVFGKTPDNPAIGFAVFTLLSLGGLIITIATIQLLAQLSCHYALAKIVALGLAFVWNFSTRRVFVFNPE